MRTLISESSTVLETSRQVIDGAILAVNVRLDTMYDGVQTAFREIHANNAGYDSIIEARGADGGRKRRIGIGAI